MSFFRNFKFFFEVADVGFHVVEMLLLALSVVGT